MESWGSIRSSSCAPWRDGVGTPRRSRGYTWAARAATPDRAFSAEPDGSRRAAFSGIARAAPRPGRAHDDVPSHHDELPARGADPSARALHLGGDPGRGAGADLRAGMELRGTRVAAHQAGRLLRARDRRG